MSVADWSDIGDGVDFTDDDLEHLVDDDDSSCCVPLHYRVADAITATKIQHCIATFVEAVIDSDDENPKAPTLYLPTSGNTLKLPFSRFTAGRVARICRVLSDVHGMLISDKYCTKRDLYYQSKGLFRTQSALDTAITVVCQLLEENRHRLHIVAYSFVFLSTARGLLMGDVSYDYLPDVSPKAPVTVSCRGGPTPIGSHVSRIVQIRSDARFILVVEKDTVLQKLIGERFRDKCGPCILITGKGYPDLGTREMTQRLVTELNIPLFCLVDADVHGIDIMVRYKYGPKFVREENKGLEMLSMNWIGVFRSETHRYPLSPDQYLPLTDLEMVKIDKLRERMDLQDDPILLRELSALESSCTKVEIEAVSNLSRDYLTDHYLPLKLAEVVAGMAPSISTTT